jgi:hypothetical protein
MQDSGRVVAGRLRLREFRDGDEEEINRVFNSAFGLSRTLAEWRWKFPVEPLRRWIIVGEDAEGSIVTHFAAVPVLLAAGERQVLAGQNVDVLALPGARAGLGASRAYLETAREFFSRYEAPQRLAVLFGFPGPRNEPLVIRQLGYRPVAAVEVWKQGSATQRSWWLGFDLLEEAEPVRIAEVWARVRHRYPVAAIRDGAWLQRRFSRRPGVEYRFLTAWRRGMPHAAAVLRAGEGLVWMCDLMWDGLDTRALRAIDRGIRSFAHRRQACRVEAWMSGDPAAATGLSDLGWTRAPHEANLRMVARSVDPELTVEQMAAGMYVTMADADLV